MQHIKHYHHPLPDIYFLVEHCHLTYMLPNMVQDEDLTQAHFSLGPWWWWRPQLSQLSNPPTSSVVNVPI